MRANGLLTGAAIYLGLLVAGADLPVAAHVLCILGLAVTGYYSNLGRFGYSAVVVVTSVGFLLVIGTVPRNSPIYFVNPGSRVWTIYLVGIISILFGIIASGFSRTPPPMLADPFGGGSDEPLERRPKMVRLFATGAVFAGCINYATGTIPLLSGDINSARLNSIDYGVLGRFWPLIIPVLQINLIVGLVRAILKNPARFWNVMATASAILLILNGGRSLIFFPLVAVGLLYLELRKPGIAIVSVLAVVVAFLLGLAGYLRAVQGSASAEAQADLGTDPYAGGLTGLDNAVQTGPRVLQLAVEKLDGGASFMHGSILFGDIMDFLGRDWERSDRVVTTFIGRDPDVIGGSPPTIFGGFFIDFGWAGVVVGGVIIGYILMRARSAIRGQTSMGSLVWYAYLATYVLISFYSYISFRPSWIVVLFVSYSLFGWKAPRAHNDGFQIPTDSGRGRDSYRGFAGGARVAGAQDQYIQQ